MLTPDQFSPEQLAEFIDKAIEAIPARYYQVGKPWLVLLGHGHYHRFLDYLEQTFGKNPDNAVWDRIPGESTLLALDPANPYTFSVYGFGKSVPLPLTRHDDIAFDDWAIDVSSLIGK